MLIRPNVVYLPAYRPNPNHVFIHTLSAAAPLLVFGTVHTNRSSIDLMRFRSRIWTSTSAHWSMAAEPQRLDAVTTAAVAAAALAAVALAALAEAV